MSDTAKWYVVHTYSGYENKVATSIENAVENRKLHDLIQEVRVPTETVVEIKDDKKREVERKLFPSYVLVKMILTDETWHILRNIRGVTGFVGSGNDAIPLSDEEIAALGVERNEVVTGYQPGDRIKIIDGPFSDYYGIVEEVDPAKERIRVVASMFNRETPVELGLDQVEYAEED